MTEASRAIDPTRGVLYPGRLPRFTRLPPPDEASGLVSWFWIPQWNLPDGVETRQPILGYPAANLAVEPDGVTLWGATTRASERVLTGTGWAVGALLRPAALGRLTSSPSELVDGSVPLDEPELHAAVVAAMPDEGAAAYVVASWLVERVGAPTPEGRLANDMADLFMTTPVPAPRIVDASHHAAGSTTAILRVEDAAAQLRVSVRTLQRLAHRTVGVSPAAMIRRRRLQEAAQRLRDDPGVTLAAVAAELGYVDHAHLANDFRRVLGLTPSEYRAAT
ncbi:helix-turn-helix domain-containing protein [Microbacterium sp. HD4P20]|uniref:helix-turn-helix domain-containing protein n=1 Tax=Microbacterium sp. HD4P20 TaxID=2864874 RepID=UPI001C63D371|nr:helix-turn-helix domain-containing protein [Microbacterium sp. HD4P20]MCP2637810.1 helix-turn-helix domain-containing protein [Microbacterium sp. HD4P20]